MSTEKQINEIELFDNYRNNMLEMVTQSVKYAEELQEDKDFFGLGAGIIDALRYSQKTLADNILPASLFSAFQKGKSTTTVAMADGHEITPCGKGGGGIRMSAVPLTIYSDRYATQVTINKYSKTYLAKRILQIAGEHLDNPDAEYDLEKEEHRKLLKAAVCQEIEVYQQIKGGSDLYDSERMSLLRNAILTIALYDSPAHRRLMADEFKSIHDIQGFISFSNELEKKWSGLKEMGFDIVYSRDDAGNLVFEPENHLYVFVESIIVPVHSEFMEETGTAVIDAPGTMASIEDTERALKAAREAAVVLYLLDGETQLSQADIDMLKVLYNAGMAEKVVFVINFRRNPLIIQQPGGIAEAILSGIRQQGYTMPHHGRLLYYNAYLAVRAAQGKLLLAGNLDRLTENAIREDAAKRLIKFKTTEEAWRKTTSRVLRAIDAEDEADHLAEYGLCEETIEEILKVSNWRTMITELRSHVMSNRIGGILRDLGARPVISALKNLESSLNSTEKALDRDVGAASVRYKNARAKLEAFAAQTDKMLDMYLPEYIDEELAKDYYDNVIMKAVDLAASEAAPQVFEESGFIGQVIDIGAKVVTGIKKVGRFAKKLAHPSSLFRDWGVKEEAPGYLQERCQTIIKAELQKAMLQKASAWSVRLERTTVYQTNIRNQVMLISEKMKMLWKDLGLDGDEVLTNIKPVPDNLTGRMSVDILDTEIRTTMINTKASVNVSVAAMLKTVGVGFGTMVGLSYVYCFVLPLDFVIPYIAEIIVLLSAAVAAVVFAVSKSKKEKHIDKLADSIAKELYSHMHQNKDAIIQSIVTGENEDGEKLGKDDEPGISTIRLFYVSLFKSVLEAQKKELADQEHQELELLKLSSEQRRKIAAKAKVWRVEKIEPLRQKLDDILEEVNDIWS